MLPFGVIIVISVVMVPVCGNNKVYQNLDGSGIGNVPIDQGLTGDPPPAANVDEEGYIKEQLISQTDGLIVAIKEVSADEHGKQSDGIIEPKLSENNVAETSSSEEELMVVPKSSTSAPSKLLKNDEEISVTDELSTANKTSSKQTFIPSRASQSLLVNVGLLTSWLTITLLRI